MRRVIINLVDNAIEATDRTRRHRARDRARPRRVRWCALDRAPTTGRAFPPADREKLFVPYYSTKKRGSGLGLAIVRRIVAEHGGDHRGRGPTSRAGARFAIELPCVMCES